MHKLIPTIYFYTVSLIGLVLLIIGVFSSIHFVVNISSGPDYPLSYNPVDRCLVPAPVVTPDLQKQSSNQQTAYARCMKGVEVERMTVKRNDLERALSFTLIGFIVFGIHFYYARRTA